ncbi:MAG TPA: STAS domain-containing protein [Herpetosiphonaceae bacterium]
MTAHSSAFGVYFRDNLESQLDELTIRLDPTRESYATEGYAERHAALKRALTVIAEGIISHDRAPVAAYAATTGERRARSRFSAAEMLRGFDQMREYLWRYLTQYLQSNPSWSTEETRAVEDILHTYQGAYFGAFCEVYQSLQGDLIAQSAALEEQRALIQQLGAPIVPIAAHVLLLPLVGPIDEARTAQITEAVLEQISQTQAEVMLVDITGVPVVDAFVANHIVSLTRAVRLLGAQVVLVGIRAEIAQTIIQLGVDIRDIVTFANLQAGIAYAMRR